MKMASRENSFLKSRRKYRSIGSALSSAVLEWILIFMLFVEAILAFLITKFASVCELQTPCLLCSRLDHILGNRRLKYYWDLICRSHKLEISSLVLCHAHNKLVDVNGMCENCLFSFATINKSNAETYRLLIGKLGEDSSFDFDTDPSNEGHIPSTKNCSCCNEPWIPRGSGQRLMQTRSVVSEAADHDVHSSDSFGNNFENARKKSGADSTDAMGGRSIRMYPLSHVQYSELNIDSDVESEVMLHDDLLSEKVVDPISLSQQSYPVTKPQSDVAESHSSADTSSKVKIGHGLEELNWEQVDCKVESSVFPELISLDEVPTSILKVTTSYSETEVKNSDESKSIFPDDSLRTDSEKNPPGKSEECNLVEEPPSLPAAEIPAEDSKQSSVAINSETPATDGDQIFKAENKPSVSTMASETIQVPVDNAQQALNLLDLSDAFKLAVGNRGRQVSSVLAELGKDSRLSEDLRQLLSQLSASREYPSSDLSPRVPVSPKTSLSSDELKTSDASNIIGMQTLQKRISLERNDSNLSMDGSFVSEIEGESERDRLKRQVEHDKKLLSALYKELEEERSASSIAANQSMAMITRLQEEKAALHMEALQCLRMMEEQAEYDIEALQKTSDLLAEREKEVQDLEAELEYYRTKYPDELMLDETNCIADLKATDVRMNHSEGCSDTFERGDDKTGANNDSLLEFEDESSYILQKLQKLEKKLYTYSIDAPCSDSGDCKHSEDERDGRNELQELNDKPKSATVENGKAEDHDPSLKSDSPGAENAGVSPQSGQNAVDMDLNSLVNEVRDLNKRLRSLEADRNFLEHSINSIRSGEEGVRFVQDIASQLKEIRKIGITRTQESIH